jgi:hypothetical protein
VAAPTTKPTASPTSNAKPPPSKSEFIRGIPVSAKAKKVAKKTTSRTPKTAPAKTASKADFVRGRAHLSPKEIVEDAKAEGVKLDAAYVYRVRAMDKTARKAKRAAAKATVSTSLAVNGALPSVASPATSSSAEDLLRAGAAELGLGRAVEILERERARVRAVLKG